VRRYNGYVNVERQVKDKTNGNGCPVPKGRTGRYKVSYSGSTRNLLARI
jgi:hypothetical protein